MPVARSYMMMDIVSEPFTQNHRQYVLVDPGKGRKPKQVRWYTDAEFTKMYPDIADKMSHPKDYIKYTLGFREAEYITIYYGATYENLNWFKAQPGCRYHKLFGWYTPSNEEVSAILPDQVSTAVLRWSDICDATECDIDEIKAKMAVEKLIYEPSNSEFIGEIGDRLNLVLTVKRAMEVANNFGTSTMHIMEDANGNVFIWTTSARVLTAGRTYQMKGSIKAHRTYRNVNQTILTRCTGVKEVSL